MATGLSEAREAAGAKAELRIACFCEAKATQKKLRSTFTLDYANSSVDFNHSQTASASLSKALSSSTNAESVLTC